MIDMQVIRGDLARAAQMRNSDPTRCELTCLLARCEVWADRLVDQTVPGAAEIRAHLRAMQRILREGPHD